LIDFNEGILNLKGRRLVLHDIHAVAQLRKDLIQMLGLEQARRILTRFGFYWGQEDAAAMERIFSWDSTVEWIKACSKLHTIQGVVRSVIDKIELDEKTGSFVMCLYWHDSGEAEEHMIEFGRSDTPVCWMLAGYASGYCSFCLGEDVYFIEHKCRAQDNRVCYAEGRTHRDWGSEIESHLQYYQAEDVKGKVERLTRQLRLKSRQLARERKRVSLLERSIHPFIVEVHSPAFHQVLELAERVAPYDSSVMITGETGTGKEVLARYIHQRSERKSGPFLGVNCTALPETLLESELFGHKAGAFTGAVADRAGLFEEAAKGTLLLDEIGDISRAMQLKILRVLQEKEIKRVGENRPRKVNVRVISATNQDLEKLVREATFREDLFYRLRVIEIHIPPLRERKEDILPLARYFVKRMSTQLKIPGLKLDAGCLDYLLNYHWPGNVRELENAIERAAVLCREGMIRPEYLPPGIVHANRLMGTAAASGDRSLAQVEQEHILAVLERTGGNRTRAARILEISPATLWRKLKSVEKER